MTPKLVSAGRFHQVYAGDCVEAGEPGAHASPMRPADLAFIDPPYNQGVDYGAGRTADKLPPARYWQWLKDRVAVLVARTRPGGAVCVVLPDEWAGACQAWMADRLHGPLGGCLRMRNWIKWHETFGVQTTDKFARTSRHVLYFERAAAVGGKTKRTFNADAVRVPSARQEKYNDKRADPRGKVPGDVWEFSRVAGTFAERVKGVPTQLPEALLTRLVLALTDPGGRVLEFCTGSGSLGVVCARHGRVYEGWERDVRTADLAAGRIRRQELTPPAAAGIHGGAG